MTPLYCRFSLRLMVAGSFFMHTITNVAISTLNLEATPEIIHDRNPTKNERHSRHNKALISLHSARHFCVFYFTALTTMLVFGSAKGDLKHILYLGYIQMAPRIFFVVKNIFTAWAG